MYILQKKDKPRTAVQSISPQTKFIVSSRLLFAIFWTWKLSQTMTHSQIEKEMGWMVHHILLLN